MLLQLNSFLRPPSRLAETLAQSRPHLIIDKPFVGPGDLQQGVTGLIEGIVHTNLQATQRRA